ncbi:MAG: F0F1 ATP synthase subunit A [Elusimicrobiota bacterium]|nr:F0F1 ATP synthase subunit A [Elusimicrobiota bacterium]
MLDYSKGLGFMTISPDVLFSVAGFPVTNTVVSTVFVDVILAFVAFFVSKTASLKPTRFQNVLEIIVDYFHSTTSEIAGKKVDFIYPWVLTFFLFILISNFIGELPGFEEAFTVSTKNSQEVSLFRTVASDLNFTLAIAVISVVLAMLKSIKYIGIKGYISRFISFKMFPIFLFVGTLEFINEFTKVVGLSFRLFGNMFAGSSVIETVYHSIAFLIVPVPFVALELMIAVIQAMVFAMLTMAFMHIMTENADH